MPPVDTRHVSSTKAWTSSQFRRLRRRDLNSADAQLYLYAYRAYDPVAGRWTQRDPIDHQDSLNLYQFCGNNPAITTDALGQHGFAWNATAEIGLIYGAGATGFGGAGVFAPDLKSFLKPEQIESGTFIGGGAFAGGPGASLKAPNDAKQEPTISGAYVGVGGGAFYTNATTVRL